MNRFVMLRVGWTWFLVGCRGLAVSTALVSHASAADEETSQLWGEGDQRWDRAGRLPDYLFQAVKRWLSPTQQLLEQVQQLRKRVEQLERPELERETVVNDQLDKLSRMIKRQRSRGDREGAMQHELPGVDQSAPSYLHGGVTVESQATQGVSDGTVRKHWQSVRWRA